MRYFRSLVSNLTSLLLAFILAIVIWATAVRSNDPVDTRLLAVDVSIIGLPEDGQLVGQTPESAQITIQGPVSALDSASPLDFSAIMDLSDVPYGDAVVPIQVAGANEQIEILSIFPESAEIRLEQIVTREVPIELQVRGEVARGHRIGNTRLEPETVQITGPSARVNSIDEGRVITFVDDAREDFLENRRPTFYDPDGNVVSVIGLTVRPPEVEIFVPVIQLAGFAEKPITVNWVGEPAPGYRLLNVSVEPSSIQVTGLPDVLETARIQTEPVDLSGLTEGETRQVTLDLPEGVSLVEIQPIVVTVEVEPILSSDVVQRPVEIRALGEGFTAPLDPAEVRVFLFGPLPVLDSLSEEDVRVNVDLLGLITGTHILEPFVAIAADNVEVRSTQPAQVTVIISGVITSTEGLTEAVSFQSSPIDAGNSAGGLPYAFHGPSVGQVASLPTATTYPRRGHPT